MNKRFDNKRLLIILAGLAVILLLTFLIQRPRKNGTLKERIADFDTSAVVKVIIHPKAGKGNPFELDRKDNGWLVKQEDIVSPAVKGNVENMMGEVLGLKPGSLAAVKKSSWKEFELTDSAATRIEFLDKKGNTLSDIMFGKMSYKQDNSQYGGYGGNNLHVTSYVRLHNDKNIYAVDGFVSFTFNTGFNDWRDKTLIKADRKDFTRVTFTYPADSSFILAKNGNIWQADGKNADSTKVAGYLNSLALMNGYKIADNFKPDSDPVYKISVEGNNSLKVNLECYAGKGTDEYMIHSSMNPGLFFSAPWKDLPERLFRPASYFLTPERAGKKTR
jgi:hypothetical protein